MLRVHAHECADVRLALRHEFKPIVSNHIWSTAKTPNKAREVAFAIDISERRRFELGVRRHWRLAKNCGDGCWKRSTTQTSRGQVRAEKFLYLKKEASRLASLQSFLCGR